MCYTMRRVCRGASKYREVGGVFDVLYLTNGDNRQGPVDARDTDGMEEENIFIRRINRKKNLTKSHYRAPKQERETARRVGGRLTAASGAKDEKGDVRLKGVARIECKTTKHASFSVTQKMLDQIEEAATLSGEMPYILVEFIDEQGKKLRDVVVCPSYVIDTLRGE